MKVTDYIVMFLREKGIKDMFGYPGGVICHLIDSVSKYEGVEAHLNYNEQGAAFAACGFAQASKKIGVAYSTSGPGATNLVTGIANAFFDSIPSIFITGQVDTYAFVDGYSIRQRGFQETNVVSMVKDISKWSVRIDNPEKIKYYMEKAYYMATEGNPGPVVLDIPADVQRADVDIDRLEGFFASVSHIDYEFEINAILAFLKKSKRPIVLVGNGVKLANQSDIVKQFAEKCNMPVVTSLPAFDILPTEHPLNYGFIGTNGHRYANFMLAKSDMIIALGSRMDIRQIGLDRGRFNQNAKFVRVDIDADQLKYRVREDEYSVCADLKYFLPQLCDKVQSSEHEEWLSIGEVIRNELDGYDDKEYHRFITKISEKVPDNSIITVDVGQHQLWVAQSFKVKCNQDVYMSAGHGAMGYAIPAGIGAHYSSKKPIIAICGDGGFMMNVQELQYIHKEGIPVKVICINNSSLGMIRGFQERNFSKNYLQTTISSGYLPPDFERMAEAFGLKYVCLRSYEDIEAMDLGDEHPMIVEVRIEDETVLEPNFGGTGDLQDQVPYIDRTLYERLMAL